MVVLSGFPSDEGGNERATQELAQSKSKLLEGVAEAVRDQSVRKELPETDIMVQYLSECSARQKLLFKQALVSYRDEMSRCTAYIEASLVGKAIDDFDKGDYRSSRIKPYEFLLRRIVNGESA